MSDTPRTDAQAYDITYRDDQGCKMTADKQEKDEYGDHVPADFARGMEREITEEKARRTYYQGIVYDVCNAIEAATGRHATKGTNIVCGSVKSPTCETQNALAEVIADRNQVREELSRAVRNRCEHCGARLNLDGCLICGAPNCCPQCCRIDMLKHEQDLLRAERDELRAFVATRVSVLRCVRDGGEQHVCNCSCEATRTAARALLAKTEAK